MTDFALAAHFLLGITGVILSYATMLSLLKKEITPVTLKQLADAGAVALLVACLGGMYHYGLSTSGVFGLAQSFALICIPIASILAATIFTLKSEQLQANATAKNTLFALVAAVTSASVLLLLVSMYITGSAA